MKIALERINRYTDWFWKVYLISHFAFEEQYIFSILDEAHPYFIQAMQEHHRLSELFDGANRTRTTQDLQLIQKELVDHIRFEERKLFNHIQHTASPQQLAEIEKAHSVSIEESWEDEFWLRPDIN